MNKFEKLLLAVIASTAVITVNIKPTFIFAPEVYVSQQKEVTLREWMGRTPHSI